MADLELNSALALLHDLILQDQLQVYFLHHSPASTSITLGMLRLLTWHLLGGGKLLENMVNEIIEV